MLRRRRRASRHDRRKTSWSQDDRPPSRILHGTRAREGRSRSDLDLARRAAQSSSKQLDSPHRIGRRTRLGVDQQKSEDIKRILTSKGFAQFGDALLNFAYSLALTETTGQPKGARVPDKTLAEAAVKTGLRKHLPSRVGRGDIANGLEALLGYSWLQKNLTIDEIVACLKSENLIPADSFARLAEMALSRLEK
jgi:hypothetical protein